MGIVEIPIEIDTKIFKKVKFYIVKNVMPLIKAGILGRQFVQLPTKYYDKYAIRM